jgi:succinate dehydrogenase hydrophobic anchor subunit
MLLDFIVSAIHSLHKWWIQGISTLRIFIKNIIISVGVAWATSTFLLSLSGLVLGFMLAFKLQPATWVNDMSNQVLVIGFWVFVIVLGAGVYLGIRALLIDIIAKNKKGYDDTFGSRVSTDDRITDIENDLSQIKNDISTIKRVINKSS